MMIRSVATSLKCWICDAGPETSACSGEMLGSPVIYPACGSPTSSGRMETTFCRTASRRNLTCVGLTETTSISGGTLIACGGTVTVVSPAASPLRLMGTSRFCEESERRSDIRPRRRMLMVSGTGVVMIRFRGMLTRESGAAKARSITRSRRGAETASQTPKARNSERTFRPRLFIGPPAGG